MKTQPFLKRILFFLLSFSLNALNAQTYHKFLYIAGNFIGLRGCCLAHEEGVMLTSQYINHPFITKLDNNGSSLWSKEYSPAISPYGFCNIIKQDIDTGYMLAGNYDTLNSPFSYLFLMKTDVDGLPIWSRFLSCPDYPFIIPRDLIRVSDGGYIICGSYATPTGGGFGVYEEMIIKIDSSGNPQWSYAIDQSVYDELFAVVELSDAYFFAGILNESMHVLKFDLNGSMIWNKKYYDPFGFTSGFIEMKNSQDGNILLTGYALEDFPASSTMGYMSLIKMDDNGNIIWSKGYRYPGNSGAIFSEYGRHIFENDSGHILVSGGVSYSPNSGRGGLLIETDANGSLLQSVVLTDNQHIIFSYEESDFIHSFTEGNGNDVMIYRLDKNFDGCDIDSVPLDTLDQLPMLIDSTGLLAVIPVTINSFPITMTSTPYTVNVFTDCILDINENEDEPGIILYPNPVTDFLQFNSGVISCNIKLTDMLGKVLLELTTNNLSEERIDLRSFSHGMYVLNIDNERFSFAEKVVVQ